MIQIDCHQEAFIESVKTVAQEARLEEDKIIMQVLGLLDREAWVWLRDKTISIHKGVIR